MNRTFVLLAAAATVAAWASVSADTLVLRDGRRLDGRLVSVSGDRIEFRQEDGRRGSRLVRLSRSEVDRIEFDESWNDDRGNWTGVRPGMREREVIVPANVPWTDTGITVRPGQTLSFASEGRVRWGPGNRRHDANGEPDSPHNPGRPIPGRPAAALIGRIGDDVFFIGGDRGPVRMRASGRLYLGINDDVLTDNSGNFRVVVYY